MSLAEISIAVGIGSTIGAIAVPAAHYAMGEAVTISSVIEGAAWGAGFTLAALASPAVALGLGIGGAVSSSIVFGPILFDSNSRPSQRFVAATLIAASLWGAQSSINYARAYNLKIQRAEQLRLNRANGKAGELSFKTYAQAAGMEIVGEQVVFKTPFGDRVVDFVIRNPVTKEMSGIEIKSSRGAFERLDTQQFSADRWINECGATASGKYSGLSINNTIKMIWPPPSS